jgi:glycosyltransferase involved in cell wall biosynthesis
MRYGRGIRPGLFGKSKFAKGYISMQSGGLRTKGIIKQSLPDQPLITVVTVVRNGEKTLEETILSVINQTYQNVEYIIVDGTSTDGTLDIIRKYEERIDYWMSEPDAGIYDAMNKSLELAHGEWILFMGSDDVFYSNTVLNVCCSFLNYNIYYGNVIFKDKNKIYPKKIKSVYQICLNNFCHQAIFYPKYIYKYLKYDIQYKYWADYVYNLTLFSRFKEKFIYLNIIFSIFNTAGAGSINKDLLFFENRLEIINHLFGKRFYYIMKLRYFIGDIKNYFFGNSRFNLKFFNL